METVGRYHQKLVDVLLAKKQRITDSVEKKLPRCVLKSRFLTLMGVSQISKSCLGLLLKTSLSRGKGLVIKI